MRRSPVNVRARVAVLAGALLIVALLTGLALRGDGPAPGVPVVPTPPGEQDGGEPIPDPFAYDPDDEDELVARAARGTSHVLYARSPGGAAATAERVARWRPQVEDAARRAGVDPDLRRGARVPRERRPRGRDGRRHRGRGRAHPDPRRDGPEPARDARRRRRQPQAHAPDRARVPARADRRGAAAAGGAPRGRRALRPGQGADRHRALPDDRARGAGPRGPRVRLLPHGDRQPPGRAAAPTARSGRPTRGSTSTRRRTATPTCSASSPRSATTPPTTCGSSARRARSCACPARTPRSSRGCRRCRPRRTPPRRCCTRPTRRRASRPRRRCGRRGTTTRSARSRTSPTLTGLARDGRMGELAQRVGAEPGLYRGLRPEALALALYIGAQTREYAGGDGTADRHLDRARRGVPAPARGPQPRGHAQLLAAHDRLGVRHRADLRVQAPGARVPVRARPAPGARRDRLGARARRHPRHRVDRRGGAAPAARAAPGARRPRARRRSRR